MWVQIRSFITHPLVAGVLAGGIVAGLAYVDAKVRKIEREKATYFKLFGASFLVVSIIVYFVFEEVSKTDEFLNQEYETEIGRDFMPKKHTGGATNAITIKKQPVMKGPIESMNQLGVHSGSGSGKHTGDDLVEILSPVEKPEMPKSSLFSGNYHHKNKNSDVSMKISRSGKKKRSSRRSHHHRHGRHHH
jgi:hypothetical protein